MSTAHEMGLIIIGLFTLFGFFLHDATVFACSGKPVVTTLSGKVQGARQRGLEGHEFCSFKGIPYAKPPIAELRFRDPEPVEPWTNVREATFHGPSCPQYNTLPHHVSIIEDCLYLNVYTKNTEPRVLRPVMVWIHGGGFTTGYGDDSLYGPEYFMRRDVVLVTFNYRLGVLGAHNRFLNLNDEEATGNQGLKDQLMVLQWVRDNIVNFGGDPYSVTIFGQSAGAAAVHYHALSPLSKGLFHKAISQSGVALNPWAFQSNPEKRAYQLCQLLGHRGKDPKSAIRFLRSMDTPKLIRAQEKLLSKEENMQMQFSFGPSIDSKSKMPFMPVHPEVAAAKGVHVPMVIGHNSREGILFYRNAAGYYDRFNREFGQLLHPDVRDVISSKYGLSVENLKRIYFKSNSITRSNTDKLVDLLGDLYFVEGIHRAVKIQAEKSLTPTYFYEFTYDKKQSFMKIYYHTRMSGACHADELFFLFRAHNFDAITRERDSDKNRITKQMIDLWVNFALTGNPTPKATEMVPLYWEPVGDGKILRYLNICENLRMGTMSSLEEKYHAYMYFVSK